MELPKAMCKQGPPIQGRGNGAGFILIVMHYRWDSMGRHFHGNELRFQSLWDGVSMVTGYKYESIVGA